MIRGIENVWKRYVLALSLIALFVTTVFLIGEFGTSNKEENAIAINVSGRQRMLSQRIALFANDVSAGQDSAIVQLTDAVNLFEKSHHALLDGDESMGLTGQAREIANDIYFEEPDNLNQQVEAYIQLVRDLISSEGGDDKDAMLAAINRMAQDSLLESLDRVVKKIELSDRYETQRIIALGRISFVLALLILVLEARFIFWPTYRYIIATLDKEKQVNEEQARLIQELTESNESKERFAYVASHDMREPARMIAIYTGMLKDRNLIKLDKTSQEYLTIANDSANHMLKSLDDLLDYSRVSTDAEKIEEVDLNKTLKLVVSNLNQNIKESGASVAVLELPSVRCNPVRIMRVFQNLIGNALKFRNETEKPKILVSAKDEGDQWVFSVVDNGIGIEEGYRQKVFEPYKRLHSKDLYAGTGMGLSVCKRIIQGLGGKIWIEAGFEGIGTEIYFTLPKVIKDKDVNSE